MKPLRPASRGRETFPVRLRALLAHSDDARGVGAAAAWLPHGRGFRVLDERALADAAATAFAEPTSLRAFYRHLHAWGFARASKGLDAGAWHHPFFLRHVPKAMKYMVRTKVKRQPRDDHPEKREADPYFSSMLSHPAISNGGKRSGNTALPHRRVSFEGFDLEHRRAEQFKNETEDELSVFLPSIPNRHDDIAALPLPCKGETTVDEFLTFIDNTIHTVPSDSDGENRRAEQDLCRLSSLQRSIAALPPETQRPPNDQDLFRRRSIAALPPDVQRFPNNQDVLRRRSIAALPPEARMPPNSQDYFRRGVPNYNTGDDVHDPANAVPVQFEDKTEDEFSVVLRSMGSDQDDKAALSLPLKDETNDDEFSTFLENIANPQHDSAALPLSSNDETNDDELSVFLDNIADPQNDSATLPFPFEDKTTIDEFSTFIDNTIQTAPFD